MYKLPEDYKQRSERVFNSSKPKLDFMQRLYIHKLVLGLQQDGYHVCLSGIDSILHLLPALGRTCSYIDYGFNIEVSKDFSSSLLKVKFDSFDSSQLSVLDMMAEPRAFVIIDLLNEVKNPEMLARGFKAYTRECDSLIFVSVERGSQRNKTLEGPPSCYYRMREWNAEEIVSFLSAELNCDSVSHKLVAQHQNNARQDIVIKINGKSLGGYLDKSLPISYLSEAKLTSEVKITDRSTFSFELSKSRKKSDSNLLKYNEISDVRKNLLEALVNDRPTSLVRVGHAEIRLLGFPDFVHPVWASRSLDVCFGEPSVSSIYDELKADMLESFINADFLGVPLRQENDQHWKHALPLLEFLGVDLSKKALHSQNIHIELLTNGILGELINVAGEVLLIGCRDIEEKIKKHFGVSDIETVKIPGEAKFVELQDEHYPSLYPTIKTEIKRKIKKLVLVGAGLPGNVYCDLAKSEGAVAIDIGSVMDIWAGANTRTSFDKYKQLILE